MDLPTLILPTFSGFDFKYILNKPVLLLILLIFFAVYSVISGVLMYHWSAYGMRSPGILVARSLFIFVSIVLFVFAGLSISYF